ncbi:MAG: putative secretion protein [Candidatus Taylorbacteria bacterium]|nr:putative secretion protein [Candidatus Taylorbacteria bacterium]
METQTKQSTFKKPWVQSLIGILVCAAILGSIIGYKIVSNKISIDLGTISAPVITISPEQSGILDTVYVNAGQEVTAGQALAHIGGETLYAKIAGTVLTTENVPGQIFNPNQAVVTMIDPQALRVVGTIDENKGLSDIKVGDVASFTVDAFGSQKFAGVVEEISPTSKDSGVAFSISDKREVRKFTIKIKYDNNAHPEFKNGMSAKIDVFIK